MSALLLVGLVGGVFVAVNLERQKAKERARARTTVIPPSPPIPPSPTPDDVYPPPPTPGPKPGPRPVPPMPPEDEEEPFVAIDAPWKDLCWWTPQTVPDAELDLGEEYVVRWRLDYGGQEPIAAHLEPSDLADVETYAYAEGPHVWVDVVIRPRKPGFGTLMVTEGEPGLTAVKGETPWRAQCMFVEIS